MLKVRDLKRESSIGRPDDMQNLITVTLFRGYSMIVPVTENLFTGSPGVRPGQAHRRPEISERSRHGKFSSQMYHSFSWRESSALRTR